MSESPRKLSGSEIRQWLKRHLGHGTFVNDRRPVSTKGVARACGIDVSKLYDFRDATPGRYIAESKLRVLGRFIQDWENGLLEFEKNRGSHKDRLIHRETPKPMPTVCRVDPLAGKLSLVPRPPRALRPPAPRNIFASLTKDRPKCK